MGARQKWVGRGIPRLRRELECSVAEHLPGMYKALDSKSSVQGRGWGTDKVPKAIGKTLYVPSTPVCIPS